MATDTERPARPPGPSDGDPPGAGGLKGLVHRYLEETPIALGPRLVQMGIMCIIVLNVGAVVVETVNLEDPSGKWVSLGDRYARGFSFLEWFSVGVFTVEYLLRLWSATVDPRYRAPLGGRLRFAATPMALVDLLAILPSYFQVAGFMAVRALRLVRIFRIFKLGHYSVAVKSLTHALVAKRAELGITLFIIGILLVLVSTVVYYAENDAQPDKFSSIPATMWWGIVTLTTVGYGDISPITGLGKLAAGLSSILGIGLVALPAGILGAAFMQELGGPKEESEEAEVNSETTGPPKCPHCGKEL